MADISNFTDTWTAVGTTYYGIKLSVTNTASAAASQLANISIDGISRFSVDYTGILASNTLSAALPTALSSSATQFGGQRVLLDHVGNLAQFAGRRTNGTWASPTALSADDQMSAFSGFGSISGAVGTAGRGSIAIFAAEAWTGTAQGTYIAFSTTTNTTVTTAIRWRIENSGAFLPGTTAVYDIGSAGFAVRNVFTSSYIKIAPKTVASLTAAATAGAGAHDFVSDALTPVFGNTVTGGGAVNVPVYSDGTNWKVG